MKDQASFTAMEDGTAEDYSIIGKHHAEFSSQLYKRVLSHLELLKGDTGGFAVDRYTHSLQSATRAYRDGRDEEYIVCALLHDIGDTIASANHAELAATMLEPFVSEENYWIIKHHGIFQGYYFFEHLGHILMHVRSSVQSMIKTRSIPNMTQWISSTSFQWSKESLRSQKDLFTTATISSYFWYRN